MRNVFRNDSPDVVRLSRRALRAKGETRNVNDREQHAFDEYLIALKALQGSKVIASYEFSGILTGRESRPPRPPRPDFTRLAQPVVRQEVEVVIDEVRPYDRSVFVRFPYGQSTHEVAEQADVETLQIHRVTHYSNPDIQ